MKLGGIANILDDRARKKIFSCYIHLIASGFQDFFFRIHCIVWHLGSENQLLKDRTKLMRLKGSRYEKRLRLLLTLTPYNLWREKATWVCCSAHVL